MLPWLREKIAIKKQRWLRPRNEEIKPQEELRDDTQEDDSLGSSTDLLQLRIVTSRLGIVVPLQVSYFDSGLQLKEKALKKLEATLSPSSSFSDDINCYKLVRSSAKQPFRDYDSILGSHVKNDEEFLLISKRAAGAIDNLLKAHSRGPTDKEILTKTKHLQLIRSPNPASLNMSIDTAFFQGDLQSDLRKILAEIAKYSAYILGSLPYGEKLIRYYRQKILMSLYNHQDMCKLLMDMGFSRENVTRALKLNGNNYSMALDWLVENVSKSSVDGNQSSMELSGAGSLDELNESTYKKLCRLFPSTSSIFYPKHKAISMKEKVEGLLEIVRYYSEKNEESPGLQDTITTLVNMGFQMDEIQQALQVTCSNQMTSYSHTAVCEWLLEHSNSPQHSNALRESIFVETHILKILLSTPQIQMSLSSPKFFIAYCSMLENYSSLNIFFNDIEAQSLLQHILRTYHEERIYFHTFSHPSPSSSS